MFLKRFVPPDKSLHAIIMLKNLKPTPSESLLGFLDKASLIAKRGNVEEVVLVSMAITALPTSVQEKIKLAAHRQIIDFNMVYFICHNINFDSLGNEILHFGVNESSNNCENFINPLQKASNRRASDSSIGDSSRLTCFYCGKKRDTRKICYKLKFDRQEKQINELSAHVGKEVDETTNERVNKDNLFYLNQVFQKDFHSKAIINVKLNNNIIHALVDTGVDISIINSKFLMGIKVLEPDISIKAANGSNIKIIGMLREMNIDIGNYEYKGKFYVYRNINYDAILGLDFIRKYFAILNLMSKK
ncbi:hypothetical protein A0H76_754 [Hepatospora eriocheir]|uniref:Peptidase A2 domain-containing protein n=1 Tax=Hepatospora eriocheir TaxID=1081669 RepID=A0A1X0QIA8_9MICR|nr:hypothetical protein A0H76_754 [Hepatospora eriocheir]